MPLVTVRTPSPHKEKKILNRQSDEIEVYCVYGGGFDGHRISLPVKAALKWSPISTFWIAFMLFGWNRDDTASIFLVKKIQYFQLDTLYNEIVPYYFDISYCWELKSSGKAYFDWELLWKCEFWECLRILAKFFHQFPNFGNIFRNFLNSE